MDNLWVYCVLQFLTYNLPILPTGPRGHPRNESTGDQTKEVRMGRPYVGYKLEGKPVPGVTTIISRFKPAGGLIHWAWQQGKDGKDYRESRDKAADAGTVAHDMVECDIYGTVYNTKDHDEETVEKATGAFNAYKEWKSQTQLEIAESEVSLLSTAHRFGGTLDAIFVRGALALGDWKTSNAVYSDYLIQLAAYAILWEENFPDRPIVGGFHLLRFGKQVDKADPITFAHYYWSNLDVAKKQFLLYREAFDLDKRLSSMI